MPQSRRSIPRATLSGAVCARRGAAYLDGERSRKARQEQCAVDVGLFHTKGAAHAKRAVAVGENSSGVGNVLQNSRKVSSVGTPGSAAGGGGRRPYLKVHERVGAARAVVQNLNLMERTVDLENLAKLLGQKIARNACGKAVWQGKNRATDRENLKQESGNRCRTQPQRGTPSR